MAAKASAKTPSRAERQKKRRLPTGKQVRGFFLDQLCYLLGCACYAASINFLVLPNHFAQSGFTGLSIVLHTLLHTPVGMVNLALNVPLILIAWRALGWRFVSKTLWVTVELSFVIDLLARWAPYTYTENPLLAAIFCGALGGFGLALIFLRGATSGGTDVVGWLVRRWRPHLSLGRVIMAADAAVVLAGALVFRSVESALYAVIALFISGRVIDSLTVGIQNGRMFYIFTAQPEAVAAAIIEQVGRGVSLLPATGAYTGQTRQMLLCVVRRSEVTRLRRLVRTMDPQAFVVVAEASEVMGEGFTS
ncbi:MAG: YitT family protein [Oscillospiraceae bacterium]|jgi:uncharacterized membrane-anchored protein YitT (DUF2179 family)|nr:YitT family protein [Oscillospiraceae bacterium]